MTLRSVKVYKNVIVREVQTSRTTRQVLQPLAAKATRAGQQVARERVNNVSGLYQRSFKSRIEPGRGGNEVARLVLENSAPYAGIIEQGSRPHIIRPRRAKVLVFQSDAGTTVFARRVSHPGTQPERVIEVALKRVSNGGAF